MKKFLVFLILLICSTYCLANNVYLTDMGFDSINSDKTFGGSYVVSKDGKYGIYTWEGKEKIPVIYEQYLFSLKPKEEEIFFFYKDGEIVILDEKNKQLRRLYFLPSDIEMISKFTQYIKIKKDDKIAWYDVSSGKMGDFIYEDCNVKFGASLVFKRNDYVLQCKEKEKFKNVNPFVTPARVLLYPVELPIGVTHDVLCLIRDTATFGLYPLFIGSDYWIFESWDIGRLP